jgi:hypothetical protein
MNKPFAFCFGDFSPALGSWVTCTCKTKKKQKENFSAKEFFYTKALKMNG